MTTGIEYWGPSFPDAAGAIFYWSEHFPDGQINPAVIGPVGTPVVANFALDLVDGAVVRFSFKTDIRKAYDGSELGRVQLWDVPRLGYQGSAYLVDDDRRATRATLARIAQLGKPVGVILVYEALTLVADSVGTTLHVNSTALRDWILAGQRVAVTDPDNNVSYGVIQSATGNTIVLDVAPGSIGNAGGEVAPIAPVLLDAQQDFGRYPVTAEQWALNGRDIDYGFRRLATVASVVLSGFTTGELVNAIAYFDTKGSIGNGWSITTVADGGGSTSVTVVGQAITFHFTPGHTLLSQLTNDLLLPYHILFTGSYDIAAVMGSGDAFGPATLAGGLDEIFGQMGTGASLAVTGAASAHGLVLQGMAVWSKGVRAPDGGAVGDSIHTLADIVELGAACYGVGPALTPDWGRQVNFDSDLEVDWQYLKLFLATMNGRQKSWWLPTMRDDLTGVSLSPGSLIVDGPSSAAGDFFAWYPKLRTLLRVELGNGTVLFFAITAAVDNGNGTLTLSVIGGGTGPSGYDQGAGGATTTDIALVSWLERCRWENDELSATWTGGAFSFGELARVVDS